jgi:hypothetical protein
MKVLATNKDGTLTTVVNVASVDFNLEASVVVRALKGTKLAGVTTSERNDIPPVPIKPYLFQLELEDVQRVQVMEDDI